MKHYNKLLLGAISFGMLAACTDDSLLQLGEAVQKPEEMAQLEYLNNYDVLKNYVNRSENPDFKLGTALEVDDYLKQELVYSLAVSNFDEMTAGNAMKYASVVADDGSMDFSKVTNFVQAAKEAGMTVYGHTLCWHSQQNKTYLERLIAPTIIPGEASDGGYCLILKNASVLTNNYDAQTWYQLSAPLANGQTYTLKFMAKATGNVAPEIYLQSSLGGTQQYPGSVSTIGVAWQEITFSFTPSDALVDRIAFNFGKFVGEIYIDDITLTATGANDNLITNSDFEDGTIAGWTGWTPGKFEVISEDGKGYSSVGTVSWKELITNGSFEEDNETSYIVQNGGTTKTYVTSDMDGGRALAVTNPSVQANDYGSQFIFNFSPVAQSGEEYVFSIDVKADVAAKITTQAQSAPGSYLSGNIFGDINVTPEWQTFTKTITIGSGAEGWENLGAVALNLGLTATTYYFDNLSFKKKVEETGDQEIEKTPEEKKEILTNALETWIKGMMNACKENPNVEEGESAGVTLVKAWDAVNEPMSDGNASQLKSASTESAESVAQSFYWQDYLGKEYAREVVKFARKYGGEDLKLFINDYNLEATYNNNAKCQGLIDMVRYWESDGVTKIDGIGTQMHVSYSLNPETQAKNEACVVKMFQLLAASGKLVKISELDMGILDENGEDIKTENVTLEQQKLMSGYYQFIISKYFEIIPAAQRYGITQWSQTDSPAESGWRAGLPIGLWNLSYNRKPTYAGFANGLAGEIIEPESVNGNSAQK